MEKLDIILWILSGACAFFFGLMIIMWNRLNQRLDKIDHRLDKLEEGVDDIDHRLCRLEGAFALTLEGNQAVSAWV